MENEIIVNEEVMEGVDSYTPNNSGLGLKIAAGVGIAALAGFVIYKVAKKIKAAKKAKAEECVECTDYAEVDSEDDSE